MSLDKPIVLNGRALKFKVDISSSSDSTILWNYQGLQLCEKGTSPPVTSNLKPPINTTKRTPIENMSRLKYRSKLQQPLNNPHIEPPLETKTIQSPPAQTITESLDQATKTVFRKVPKGPPPQATKTQLPLTKVGPRYVAKLHPHQKIAPPSQATQAPLKVIKVVLRQPPKTPPSQAREAPRPKKVHSESPTILKRKTRDFEEEVVPVNVPTGEIYDHNQPEVKPEPAPRPSPEQGPRNTDEFRKTLKDLASDLTPDQIYYCDISRVYVNVSESLLKINYSSPLNKIDHLIFFACCNATGSHKLPLMSLPRPCNAMDRESISPYVFLRWFTDRFIPNLNTFAHDNNLSKKALLLVDNTPATCKQWMWINKDVKVILLKPIYTVMRPIDIGLAHYIKFIFRKRLRDFFTQISSSGLPCKLTFRQASRWLSDIWRQLDDSNIRLFWRDLEAEVFQVTKSEIDENGDWKCGDDEVDPLSDLTAELSNSEYFGLDSNDCEMIFDELECETIN